MHGKLRARRLRLQVGPLLAALLASPAAGFDTVPVARLEAAGGRVAFRDGGVAGRPLDSPAGSAAWRLGAGLRLSEDDTLVPLASGSYMRRRQVSDVAGSATATTETLTQSAGLRYMRALGSWTLKPNVSYQSRLEASGEERLGRGMFDRRQTGAGLEAEWKRGPLKSLRLTASAARARYYHYQAARSTLFGAELLLDDRALDASSYDLNAASDWAAGERWTLSASAGASRVDYPHQVVFEGATTTGRARRDLVGSWTLGASRAWAAGDGRYSGSAGLTAGFSMLSSNQNDVDPGQSSAGVLRENPDFYSYSEWSAGPTLGAGARGGWRASLSYQVSERAYRARPAQDASGGYLDARARTRVQTLSWAASYPVLGGLSAQASGGWVKASSNTRFERYSLYNYSYPYLFIGAAYAL